MRLYYFNPNDYGEEAFVMAENEDQAKDALIIGLAKFVDDPRISDFAKEYEKSKVKSMVEGLSKYTIDSFGPGEVVYTEIC